MFATVGDRLVVHNMRLGGPVRDAGIREVSGAVEALPYLAHWSDTGHQGWICPGRTPRSSTSSAGRPRSPDHGTATPGGGRRC